MTGDLLVQAYVAVWFAFKIYGDVWSRGPKLSPIIIWETSGVLVLCRQWHVSVTWTCLRSEVSVLH